MRQKSTGQVPTAVSGYGRLQVDPWSRLESSCRLPWLTFSQDWLCQPGRHKQPAPAWRSAPSRAMATLLLSVLIKVEGRASKECFEMTEGLGCLTLRVLGGSYKSWIENQVRLRA